MWVLAIDTPRALTAAFAGRLLEVCLELPRRARAAVEALPGVVRAHLFGDRLHVTLAPEIDPGELGRRLAAAGHPAGSIVPIEPSLEDVFLARVAEAGREAA